MLWCILLSLRCPLVLDHTGHPKSGSHLLGCSLILGGSSIQRYHCGIYNWPSCIYFEPRFYSESLCCDCLSSSLNLKMSMLYLHNTGADILVNQIAVIIEHVVEKPSTSPNDLSFLPHTLQSRDDCYVRPPSYTHTKPAASVVEYIICCSIATPNKIAIKFFSDLRALDLESVQPGEFITYAKLHRCSNQFTCYLVEKGIEWEDHITVCSQCGANFHIVMFGVLKAGVIGIMQFRINLPYELQ